jgi:hypothetical protein
MIATYLLTFLAFQIEMLFSTLVSPLNAISFLIVQLVNNFVVSLTFLVEHIVSWNWLFPIDTMLTVLALWLAFQVAFLSKNAVIFLVRLVRGF